jgi:hypothetical protein
MRFMRFPLSVVFSSQSSWCVCDISSYGSARLAVLLALFNSYILHSYGVAGCAFTTTTTRQHRVFYLPSHVTPSLILCLYPNMLLRTNFETGTLRTRSLKATRAKRFWWKRCSSREIMYFLAMRSLAIEVDVMERMILDL